MRLTLEAEGKEIAALVLELQERHYEKPVFTGEKGASPGTEVKIKGIAHSQEVDLKQIWPDNHLVEKFGLARAIAISTCCGGLPETQKRSLLERADPSCYVMG